MRRVEAAYFAEDRARAADMAEAEEIMDRAIVDGEAVAGQQPQGLQLRREGQAAILL